MKPERQIDIILHATVGRFVAIVQIDGREAWRGWDYFPTAAAGLERAQRWVEENVSKWSEEGGE